MTNTPLKKTCSYDGKVIIDSLGRSITLRKPKMQDHYMLRRVMKEDSSNSGCFELLFPLLFVAKIDDFVMGTPVTFDECMINLNRLDQEGTNAVGQSIGDLLIKEQEEALENAKKS